jgi:DNA-binding IclR family transcriptional regulator
MDTIRRRQLKPRGLSASGAQMLRFIRSTQAHPRTTRELAAASGTRVATAWNALIQLQERQLIRITEAGHVVLTKAGAEHSGRAA